MLFNLQLTKKTFSPPYILKRIDMLKSPTTATLSDLNTKRKTDQQSYFNHYLGDIQLIGRNRQLDLLKTELSKLQTNTNAHIAFVGKRGVGKTALARQFMMWSSHINSDDHVPNIFSSPKHKKAIDEHNTKTKSTQQPFYHTCYLDFERMAMTPEQFAIEYVGTFCYLTMNNFEDSSTFTTQHYAYTHQSPLFTKYMDISFLLNLNLPESLHETIAAIQNELEKITPDQKKLLSLAFEFPKKITEVTHKRIVMIVDNFEHLFSLNNYKKLNPVERLFEKHLQNSFCIILSEQEYTIKQQMSKFQIEQLPPLNQAETFEFSKTAFTTSKTNQNIIQKEENDNFVRMFSPLIYHFTQGNPLFIKSLVDDCVNTYTTLLSLTSKKSFKKTIEQLQKTDEFKTLAQTLSLYIPYGENITNDEQFLFRYLISVLSLLNSITNTEGKLHLFYQTYLEKQLETARGKTLLHSILKVLTEKEGAILSQKSSHSPTGLEELTRLRLSDIARQIYRSPPVTKNLLVRLIEVNLINHANNTYFIQNKLLRRWLYLHFHYLTHNTSLPFIFETTMYALETTQSSEEYNHNLFLLKCLFNDCTNYLTLFL